MKETQRPFTDIIDHIVFEIPWSLDLMPLLDDLSILRAGCPNVPPALCWERLHTILWLHLPDKPETAWQRRVDDIVTGRACRCASCWKPVRPQGILMAHIALVFLGIGFVDRSSFLWPILTLSAVAAGIWVSSRETEDGR